MLAFGPADASLVLIAALPLFEEANRTRTFLVAVLRALAERGITSLLPDMPGQGESVIPTADTSLSIMRDAYDSIVAGVRGRAFGISIRSGALIDPLALLAARWQLAPQTGAAMLRDLSRTRRAATGVAFDPLAHTGPPVEIAGNLLSPAMLLDLTGALSSTAVPRIVRLDSDPRDADRKLAGPPLWRQAEPGTDPMLVATVAQDIADWVGRCGE